MSICSFVLPMDSKQATEHTIYECMECGEQWAEKVEPKFILCHWCFSNKVAEVCKMSEQIHLLQHEQANP